MLKLKRNNLRSWFNRKLAIFTAKHRLSHDKFAEREIGRKNPSFKRRLLRHNGEENRAKQTKN